MISTHNSAANRIRIGQERSILCGRAASSAGSAMAIQAAPNSLRKAASHLEDLGVARVDLLAHPLDSGGIVLPQLDLIEAAYPRLLLGEGMDGMLAGKVDQQLLGLERMQPVLEQARGVRIGRRREHRAWTGNERCTFRLIDHLDRLTRLLELDQIVVVAVRHDRALAERELLRRVGR